MIYLVSNQSGFAETYSRATPTDIYDYFSGADELQVDTESEGFDPYQDTLISLQVGDEEHQYVIDTTTVPVEEFRELLEDKLLLLHNAAHDLKFFYHYNIDPTAVYDSFLAECILTTGYPKKDRQLSLEDVAYKYNGARLDKDQRQRIMHRGLIDSTIKYAAEDVQHLQAIKRQQVQQLAEWQMANPDDTQDKDTVLGLENRSVRVFARMQYDGVYINQDKWRDVIKRVDREVGEQIETLDGIIASEPDAAAKYMDMGVQANLWGGTERAANINYNSTQQKLDVLHRLGMDDLDSTAKDILQKHEDRHPIIEELIEYNRVSKLQSSFGEKFLEQINDHTGCAHPDIWQILHTGRISTKKPNVNQIPKGGEVGPLIRSCFEPRHDGWKIVGGDYSQFELRIIAQCSGDPLWIDIFNDPEKDLHSRLCAETFEIPVSKVHDPFPSNPTKTYRDTQKNINYGLAYGMTEYKFSKQANIPVEEARGIIDDFFTKVPKVQQFLEKLADLGLWRGYIRTPYYHRTRWFPDHKQMNVRMRGNRPKPTTKKGYQLEGTIRRASKNTPIQGANGDIIKRALIRAYEEIQANDWPVNIILSVYDEIQTECAPDFAPFWRDQLQTIMEEEAEILIDKVPVEAECAISDYWDK